MQCHKCGAFGHLQRMCHSARPNFYRQQVFQPVPDWPFYRKFGRDRPWRRLNFNVHGSWHRQKRFNHHLGQQREHKVNTNIPVGTSKHTQTKRHCNRYRHYRNVNIGKVDASSIHCVIKGSPHTIVSMNDKSYVKIECNGIQNNALVDSGACTSCISESFSHKLRISKQYPIKSIKFTSLKGVSGFNI